MESSKIKGNTSRKGQSKKRSGTSETSVGGEKTNVEGRLGKEAVALQQIVMATNKLRCRDRRVKGKRGDRKDTGEIFEVSDRCREKYTKVHGHGRA